MNQSVRLEMKNAIREKPEYLSSFLALQGEGREQRGCIWEKWHATHADVDQ